MMKIGIGALWSERSAPFGSPPLVLPLRSGQQGDNQWGDVWEEPKSYKQTET